MTKHAVNITTGPDRPRFEIDGHDITRGLSDATITFGPSVTRIALELTMSVIDVMQLSSPDAEVMLSLPTGAREALIALGWTPPAQDAR